ncbi:MAG: tryptophan--tRNA ligase, partial [Haloferacaceae archaeon]|nr:tryptophan--tRNA ligase [Haloferacaceae archaeon]
DPASHIALTDPPAEGAAKVRAATTAGQPTEALQRERGGDPDACPVYELYAYTLAGDDDALTETVYTECAGGERLCGDCKAQAAELMEAFLADHQERRAAAEATLAAMDVELTSPRRRD